MLQGYPLNMLRKHKWRNLPRASFKLTDATVVSLRLIQSQNSKGTATVEVREETVLEISGLLTRSHSKVRSPFRTEAHYCGAIFRRICEQRTLSPCLKGLSLTCWALSYSRLLGNVKDYVWFAFVSCFFLHSPAWCRYGIFLTLSRFPWSRSCLLVQPT